MKKKTFTITIKAPRNIVWHTLWQDATYRQWTNPFCEGSYAISDWKEGSEIQFLSPNGAGIYSLIDRKNEPEYIAFKHIGELKAGQKLPKSDWSGAMETYALTETGDTTNVAVEIDINEEHMNYFATTWPKALEKLKEISESPLAKLITVETIVQASIEKTWNLWTNPNHICNWNSASEDWHTTKAENNLKKDGLFNYRMEAKDGSFGFDFSGKYISIKKHEKIEAILDDGRCLNIFFKEENGQTHVVESFEAETINSLELQKLGWQAILTNFKKYTETN